MTAKILPFKKRVDTLTNSDVRAPSKLIGPSKEEMKRVYDEINLLDLYLKYVEEHHIHDIDLQQYEEWVVKNYPEKR